MSTDLHTRLLAAVQQRMDVARAAILDESPNWHADKPVGPLDGAVNNGKRRLIGGWQRAVEHAAANDPATVLRHCERDMRVLERHQPAFYAAEEIIAHSLQRAGFCTSCEVWTNDTPEHEDWPCAEITDLAAAYGIDADG